MPPFALAFGGQVVDEMRGDETDQCFEKHGGECEDRRLPDHHPEHVARQQICEIRQTDKAGLRLVQHRKIDRIERGIDDQPHHDGDQRQAHQKCYHRVAAHEASQTSLSDRRFGDFRQPPR